jgi:hypothetical protein
VTLLWKYPYIQALAVGLLDRLGFDEEPASDGDAAADAALAESLDALSDDDLLSRLDSQLEDLS